MAKEPGNTLQTAKLFPLRSTTTRQTAKDSLSAADPVDIWRLNNRSRSSLDLSLSGISRKASVNIALLNSRGQTIRSTTQRGNRAKPWNDVDLETGTFYIRIKLQRRSADTRYALTLSSSSNSSTIDAFGNSFETATSLRSATGVFNDFVGSSDPNDFLRLGTLIAGQFNVSLTGLSNDANLELYNQNKQLIFASTNGNAADESLNQRLTDIAGSTYYLRINSVNQGTPYKLNYSFVSDATTQTASGLRYIDLAAGSGNTPAPGQTVTVNYTGILTDGTQFDSSRAPNRTPFSFPIGAGRVIAGWEEGISSMRVGGRRQLIIPASLAYGSAGIPGTIPGNATLIFDVEVLGIQ